MFKKINGTRKQCFFKSDNRFTYLLWECILLFLLLCSASGASCLSRATGCLSELSCGGRLSFYVYLCVCVCVHYVFMYSCVCVCVFVWVKGWGGSWPGLFFSAPALGSPHSSCDWCAPVADRAEARAQGPAEADVYLWSETASVRGPRSSNILILTNTALGLIFSS